MLWSTTGKSARLTGVTVTTIGAGPFGCACSAVADAVRLDGVDPVMQPMGKPAGGGNPPVRGLGRIGAIGDRRAARQHGDPREPGIPITENPS